MQNSVEVTSPEKLPLLPHKLVVEELLKPLAVGLLKHLKRRKLEELRTDKDTTILVKLFPKVYFRRMPQFTKSISFWQEVRSHGAPDQDQDSNNCLLVRHKLITI